MPARRLRKLALAALLFAGAASATANAQTRVPAGQRPIGSAAGTAPTPTTSAAPAATPHETQTFSLSLKHAAYRHEGAASVAVHVPAGFEPKLPLELVVFLHGFKGCTRVLMEAGKVRCRPEHREDSEEDGWALAQHHDDAHTNSVLVIPQLAYLERSSKPGCFGRAGCFDAFLGELLADLRTRLGLAQLDASQVNITLVAHSAGYQTALAILDRASAAARVQNVVLLDALYGGSQQFAYWLQRAARRNVRMLSLYLNEGDTRKGSRDLYKRMRRALGRARVAETHHDGLPAALAAHKTLVVSTGRGIHREVPANYLAQVLAAWLPPRTN
jgi:hypothetical protein